MHVFMVSQAKPHTENVAPVEKVLRALRPGRMLGVIVASVALFVGGIAVAPAAQAHGGAIEFLIAQDGGGGLVVNAQYVKDGHAVDDPSMKPTVLAVAEDGTTVGPEVLLQSQEGMGLYVTDYPILDTGVWSVTVSIDDPVVATSTKGIEVRSLGERVIPEQAPPVEEFEFDASTAEGGETTEETVETDTGVSTGNDQAATVAPLVRRGFTGWLWIGGAAIVLALGSVVFVVIRRRRLEAVATTNAAAAPRRPVPPSAKVNNRKR